MIILLSQVEGRGGVNKIFPHGPELTHGDHKVYWPKPNLWISGQTRGDNARKLDKSGMRNLSEKEDWLVAWIATG